MPAASTAAVRAISGVKHWICVVDVDVNLSFRRRFCQQREASVFDRHMAHFSGAVRAPFLMRKSRLDQKVPSKRTRRTPSSPLQLRVHCRHVGRDEQLPAGLVSRN